MIDVKKEEEVKVNVKVLEKQNNAEVVVIKIEEE